MSEQSGRNESPERSGSQRPQPATPAADMLSDLQRWLIRSSAKSMRKEISGQVRRTFSGGSGQRASAAEVWDTATTEIPPETGESPECQWCPICRAARRMRVSGPGLGGQLSGAGDAVASAVQDAISALDSILSKPGGSEPRGTGPTRAGSPAKPRPGQAADQRDRDDVMPADAGSDAAQHPDAQLRDAQHPDAQVADAHIAGDHGPGGWKPGDRLATEHNVDADPWAGATDADEGTDDGGAPSGADEAQPDGPGHGPDDRG